MATTTSKALALLEFRDGSFATLEHHFETKTDGVATFLVLRERYHVHGGPDSDATRHVELREKTARESGAECL